MPTDSLTDELNCSMQKADANSREMKLRSIVEINDGYYVLCPLSWYFTTKPDNMTTVSTIFICFDIERSIDLHSAGILLLSKFEELYNLIDGVNTTFQHRL